MLARNDFWDPNTWDLSAPCRIYGPDCGTFALVSPEDYQWALQWQWNWKRNAGGLMYLKRNEGPERTPIYLHVEIAKRANLRKRSSLHNLVDHKDRDSTNCQRSNLRYVTRRTNRLNARDRYEASDG